jgi:predicted dehydrogenase
MNRTRVGIIGAGTIAGRHLANLMGFEDVEVVAIADLDLDRARRLAERCGSTAYDDVGRMLDAQALDAAYVCVPPFAHGAPEAAVLARDLPFFVEKPVAADLDTAERIATEVATRGLITGVGYHWRYLDVVEWARELLARNPARLATGYWLDFTPPPAWWTREALSGGQMVEQTTHIFDLARHLVGEATSVYATASRSERPDFAEADICDVSVATLRFASGAIATISSTCLLRWTHRVGLHLFCEGMALEVAEQEVTLHEGVERVTRRAQGDPFVREDRDFIDAIQGKPNRIRVPYGEALDTHRLVMAAATAAREGRPVGLGPREGRA